MKDTENDYRISLFKPTTERARFNRNLVVWLASIWFIAIFGFQIALRVLETPTPQPSFTLFEKAWPAVKAGTASDSELQDFAYATLSVLGKVAIVEDERKLLSHALSWSVFKLLPDETRTLMLSEVGEFEAVKAGITEITDQNYVQLKREIARKTAPVIALEPDDPRQLILPIELTTSDIGSLSEGAMQKLPAIMQKYLVHNESILTNTIFLGFPFHYFYTALFLLVLFVGLCWIYCVRSDRRNVILGIED